MISTDQKQLSPLPKFALGQRGSGFEGDNFERCFRPVVRLQFRCIETAKSVVDITRADVALNRFLRNALAVSDNAMSMQGYEKVLHVSE
jgi:hypothetical protein